MYRSNFLCVIHSYKIQYQFIYNISILNTINNRPIDLAFLVYNYPDRYRALILAK